MADFYPVADLVKPPDPNQAFTSMNNILGLQQRKLGLESSRQQLELQGQEIQRSQIQTQQEQGVNNFFGPGGWNPAQHHGDDGTLDIESAHSSDQYAALPGVAKLAVDSKLNAIKGQQLDNKSKLSSLNGEVVGQFAKAAQAWSLHPEQGPAQLQAFSQQGPDQARIAGIYGPLLTQAKFNPDALRTVAAQAQDITAQQPKAITNAAGQNLLQQPGTGAIFAPPGAEPGSPINPASSTVAGQTTRQVYGAGLAPSERLPYVAQRASAAARATGGASSDIERGNQVSALIQPSNNGISLTKEIDDLAEQVHSGKFVASISKAAAAVGMKEDTYARQVLEKDLGRLKTLATEGAGSDARAGTILSGFPTAESDTQTLHNAMDYTRGVFKQNLARGTLLNKVKEKDPSLTGLQHADDTLTSRSDPLMHEFQSLKSPQERISFYKRHFTSPADAQEFKAKVAGMGHILGQ
jgi:hypothetical protein